MPSALPIRRTPLDPWCARQLGVAVDELTRDRLERHQLARLRETTAWARERSPHYRARQGGAEPSSLADLPQLPFTTPAELREHGPRMVCVSQDEISRVVTLCSSGTTGSPKRVYFSAAEQESIVDFFAAGMSTMVEPGERVVIFLPGSVPGSVGDLLATALRRIGVAPVPHGPVRDVREAAQALRGDRPTSLVALPVHALALARWVDENAPGAIALKSALLTADHVARSLTAGVERALSCTVFEHYGMTEMGLGGGVECEAHQGYHLREADLLFEVVDPDSGASLPDGAEGEVVFTTLTRRAMPLLRYRTGDRARLLPGPCPCGSALRRLSRVCGRLGAVSVGGVTLPALDELLFACSGVVDYTARVASDGPRSELHITALTLGPAGVEVARALAEVRDVLVQRATAEVTPEVTIDIASLGGRVVSGPEKRTLARTEAGAGPGRP